MTHSIRHCFDRAGASYESVALAQRRVAADVAARCPETLDGPVLEIGAGSGLLTRLLTPRLVAGCHVALDISPGMLTHAAMPGAIKLAADGERPPFRPGTFGFLASSSAMQWYADPARSLPADLALVRPGGGFALAIFVEGTLAELAEASQATGFGSVHPMRPAADYRAILSGLPGVRFTLETTVHKVSHPTVVALLKSLKGAGVTHTPRSSAPSASRYKAFTRYYQEHFATADGVTASYAVAYFCGRLEAPPRDSKSPRLSSRQA